MILQCSSMFGRLWASPGPRTRPNWSGLKTGVESTFQRDPVVAVWAKWFFGGLGYQGQNPILVQENTGLLALPPKTARPKNHYVYEKV
jgi:hypothetical protein